MVQASTNWNWPGEVSTAPPKIDQFTGETHKLDAVNTVNMLPGEFVKLNCKFPAAEREAELILGGATNPVVKVASPVLVTPRLLVANARK